MRHGIMTGLIVLGAAIAGCGNEGATPRGVTSGSASAGEYPLDKHGLTGHEVLRIRKDARRHRLWVLTLDGVRVYGYVDERPRLIREIPLPNWSVAHHPCDPDLVLDGVGSAVIASNVNPRLWLIDADSLALTEREIRLQQKEQWDIGFRALSHTADGALIAWASWGDSLWEIDAASGSARSIDFASPPTERCGFPAQWLQAFERSRQP